MSNDKFVHDRAYHGDDFMKFPYPKIVVCGVGTLGSTLVDNLVRQNITNLRLVDDDRVEPHNLGNQIWKNENIGQKKVDAAQMHAYNVTEVLVEVEGKRLTTKTIKKTFKDADLVVDCFDNSESRQLIQDYCLKAKLPCLHTGLASDYCEVAWNDVYKVPAMHDEDVCDYPMTRNISMVAVVLATRQIIDWILGRSLENSVFTLNDFVKRKY